MKINKIKKKKKQKEKGRNRDTCARVDGNLEKKQRHVSGENKHRALDANPVAKKRNAKWAERRALVFWGEGWTNIDSTFPDAVERRRFLPSFLGTMQQITEPQPHVRPQREEACCERVVEFRDDDDDGSFSIYAYVQIFLPLDSRTKGVGRGRKDEETRV